MDSNSALSQKNAPSIFLQTFSYPNQPNLILVHLRPPLLVIPHRHARSHQLSKTFASVGARILSQLPEHFRSLHAASHSIRNNGVPSSQQNPPRVSRRTLPQSSLGTSSFPQ